MEIVKYNTDYRDDLIYLIHQFVETSLEGFGMALDESKIDELEQGLGETTFLLLDGKNAIGVIGGKVVDQFTNSAKVYQEVIWYVSKEHRSGGIRLLRYLENWCADNDIGHIVMCRMHNSMPSLGIFYEKMGYEPMETQYIKKIPNNHL